MLMFECRRGALDVCLVLSYMQTCKKTMLICLINFVQCKVQPIRNDQYLVIYIYIYFCFAVYSYLFIPRNMNHRAASSSPPSITLKISSSLWYCTFITILFFDQTYSELEKPDPRGVRINKCCEPFEILIDARCTQVNDTTTGTVHTNLKSNNKFKLLARCKYSACSC